MAIEWLLEGALEAHSRCAQGTQRALKGRTEEVSCSFDRPNPLVGVLSPNGYPEPAPRSHHSGSGPCRFLVDGCISRSVKRTSVVKCSAYHHWRPAYDSSLLIIHERRKQDRSSVTGSMGRVRTHHASSIRRCERNAAAGKRTRSYTHHRASGASRSARRLQLRLAGKVRASRNASADEYGP